MTGTTGQGVTEENGSTEGKERGRPEKKNHGWTRTRVFTCHKPAYANKCVVALGMGGSYT
jgi:hypothetical protein